MMWTMDRAMAFTALHEQDPSFRLLSPAESSNRINALLRDYYTEDGGEGPVWTYTQRWLDRGQLDRNLDRPGAVEFLVSRGMKRMAAANVVRRAYERTPEWREPAPTPAGLFGVSYDGSHWHIWPAARAVSGPVCDHGGTPHRHDSDGEPSI